jgi:hypothetical protein
MFGKFIFQLVQVVFIKILRIILYYLEKLLNLSVYSFWRGVEKLLY